jgi:hypothetical protein
MTCSSFFSVFATLTTIAAGKLFRFYFLFFLLFDSLRVEVHSSIKMDYKGQQLCEYIYSIITIVFSVISWFVGYYKNDFIFTFYGWAIGLGISLVVSCYAYSFCCSFCCFFSFFPFS